MALLNPQLQLPRCPHCNIDKPNLWFVHQVDTADHAGQNVQRLRIYKCANCGKLVSAWAHQHGQETCQIFPEPQVLDELIPERPRFTYIKPLNRYTPQQGQLCWPQVLLTQC